MKIHSICQKYFVKKISIDQACRNDVWYDGMHVITMATNLLYEIEAKWYCENLFQPCLN